MGRQATPEVRTAEAPAEAGERLATLPRSDRQGGESELRVSLDEYQGHPFVSIRLWTRDKMSGAFWPTRKGTSVRLSEVEGVMEALAAAQRLADKRRPPARKSGGDPPRVEGQRGSTRRRPGSGDFDEFGEG